MIGKRGVVITGGGVVTVTTVPEVPTIVVVVVVLVVVVTTGRVGVIVGLVTVTVVGTRIGGRAGVGVITGNLGAVFCWGRKIGLLAW